MMNTALGTWMGLLATTAAAQPSVAFDSLAPDRDSIGASGCRDCETARLVTLETTPNSYVTALQFRLWNTDSVDPFTGQVRAAVYMDNGNPGVRPGDEITSGWTDLSFAPGENRIVTIDLPDALIPSDKIWISYYIPGDETLGWVFNSVAQPAVGTMTDVSRSREDGTGDWVGRGYVPQAQEARVLVIPAPGTAMAIGLVGIALRRRRNTQ
ncbi:MAG: hypothetical protein ACIAQ0_12610 [Phycisphaerales bacterium JB058]